MVKFKKKERWLSGRKRLIANPLYELFRTEGSNPSLSVRAAVDFIPSYAARSLGMKRSLYPDFGARSLGVVGPCLDAKVQER